MANILDVAKAAQVSVATVSRVLNNSPLVSPDKREAVLDAIKKFNYQPNLLGRNLRRTQTKMVLLLLPTIANPFFSRIVKGIEDIAHNNNYHILLCNTDSNVERERFYLELLKQRLADGVIFIAPELDKDELNAISEKYPVVQCSEYREGTKTPHILIDNVAAAYGAVKHLNGLGKKRIGLISCDNGFLSTKRREEGYKKALGECKIPYDPDLVVYGDYGFKSGLRAAKQLLSLENQPTAIFAISDMMAIGAMKAIRENNLRIPEDIAVVGFDGINFASMCEPMLTTIAQPAYDLGCASMEILLKEIGGESMRQSEGIFLEHEMVIRGSTVK